ncbi:MAG: PPC domain-containing protein [Trueperaceae bacterium]
MVRSLFPLLLVALTLMGCAPTMITALPGAGADGRLDSGDEQLESGEFFETYTYAGSSGDLLTISLASDAIDPYLMVLDPDGDKIAEIDDSPGHGYNVVITVSLPVTGSYVIIVTSAFPGETGAYTLDLAPGSRITPSSPSSVWGPVGAATAPPIAPPIAPPTAAPVG